MCSFSSKHRHAMFLQKQCGKADRKSEAMMIFCSLTDMLEKLFLHSISHLTRTKRPNQSLIFHLCYMLIRKIHCYITYNIK